MKIRPVALLLCVLLGSFAIAGTPATQSQEARATEIGKKIRQLDLLNQILPVLMTKEQLKALVPVIAKARAEERELDAKEFKMMVEKEAKVAAAIKEAKEKKQVPSRELVTELGQMYTAFTIGRQILIQNQVENVRAAMEKHLNKGQIKAAANALNPKIFDPKADLESITEDQKLKLWIRNILLDPLAYELLVELSK